MKTNAQKRLLTVALIATFGAGMAACAYDDYGDHHRGDRNHHRGDRNHDRGGDHDRDHHDNDHDHH